MREQAGVGVGASGHRVDPGPERKKRGNGRERWHLQEDGKRGQTRCLRHFRRKTEKNLISSTWGRKVKRQTPRRHVSLALSVTTRNYLECSTVSILTLTLKCSVPRERWKIREEEGSAPKEMSNPGCSMTGLHVPVTWQNTTRSSRTRAPQPRRRETNWKTNGCLSEMGPIYVQGREEGKRDPDSPGPASSLSFAISQDFLMRSCGGGLGGGQLCTQPMS